MPFCQGGARPAQKLGNRKDGIASAPSPTLAAPKICAYLQYLDVKPCPREVMCGLHQQNVPDNTFGTIGGLLISCRLCAPSVCTSSPCPSAKGHEVPPRRENLGPTGALPVSITPLCHRVPQITPLCHRASQSTPLCHRASRVDKRRRPMVACCVPFPGRGIFDIARKIWTGGLQHFFPKYKMGGRK